jgi:uncharacterized membrane protein YccF (DUF307 family)
MNILGNIIWLLFGGFVTALEYLICSILLMVTIIGIPFGLQTLKLASLALWPFGRTTVYREQGTGCLFTIMNVLWILMGGIWIALTHVIFGVLLFITLIGIPFGRQHFKLASLALTPFNRTIVHVD